MEAGTRGSCRSCGEPVEMVFTLNHWSGRPSSPFWRHVDLERGECRSEFDDPGVHCKPSDPNADRLLMRRASPREWCWMMKEDSHHCEKAVRDENRAGGFFACGVHMKRFVELLELDRRRKDKAEDAEAKKALEEWEFGIYNVALANLHAANPELFPESSIRSQSSWRGWSRTVEVDIADLERWLREYAAYSARDGWESSGQDDDSLLGLFEQPQEAG